MKKRFIKLVSSTVIATSLTVLLCGCKGKGYFKYEGKIYDDSYNYKNDYGYKYLAQTNEKAAKFYENMFLQMTEFNHKKQDVKEEDCHTLFYEQKFSESALTFDDLYQGYSFLTAFHPEYYWMGYTLEEENDYYALGISRKYAKASERKTFDKKLNSELKKIDKLVSEIEDKYDLIKTISDYIMDNMTYSFDDEGNPSQEHWAHSITGFFDRKTGVCESYAKVFKLLCDRYGIGNLPVTSEDHIWNLVEYENEWYVYDLTYDDDYRNSYVGKTEEAYKDASHEYHKDLFKLPENMAKTPLSFGRIDLKENNEVIYSSHSMDLILDHLNNGNYEIILNSIEGTNTTYFHLSYIDYDYSTLTFKGIQKSGQYVSLVLNDDLELTKDLTLSNFFFEGYIFKKITINDDSTLYLEDITDTGILFVGNVVRND
ncbi:MAG: transglutaminase domain-containing protein [Acholeplasmatales bacterium]|nr:transglutaminase domain-containing protein [Acholeplasmatales bacterium]